MKKKALALGAAIVLSLSLSTVAFASSNAAVTLTSNNEIEYTSNAGETTDGVYLGDAFSGMAAGEEATQTITITNSSSHEVSFFLKQDTLETMEALNQASGGAYTVTLSVGSSQESATTILDATAGGYDTNSTASIDGLADITELQSYSYLAKLATGESTNLYLTVKLNGEGFDSTTASDYTNKVAQLGFNFRAYYADAGTPTVITKIVNQTTGSQTGDTSNIWIPAVALAAGVILVIVAVRKRKAVR